MYLIKNSAAAILTSGRVANDLMFFIIVLLGGSTRPDSNGQQTNWLGKYVVLTFGQQGVGGRSRPTALCNSISKSKSGC